MLVRCNMGYGYRINGDRVGWCNDVQGRERAYAAKDWTELPSRIVQTAERLRGVQIECRPAVDVIQRFNHSNVLVYADPPYVLGSRADKRGQYRHEMTDADHRDLLDVLLAHKGPAVISGYPSGLYDDALRGWHREEIGERTQSGARSREVIWLNYEPESQLSMLGQIGGQYGDKGRTDIPSF